jgi:hypothetical protein
VVPRLEREAGKPLAGALAQVDAGTRDLKAAAAVELVRQSSQLAAWIRGLS